MYVTLVTINKSLRCTVTIDSCVLILCDHTLTHIHFNQEAEKSFYDHLSLFQIKAYDQVITCSYVSHRNVLAGKIVT